MAPAPRRSAFTLTELLVVISVLAIVSGLAFAAQGESRRKAQRLVATSQLRQIGSALLLHAAERNQVLPGPLWPGQVPVYDASRPGRLPVELAPYLGLDPHAGVRVIDLFVPPGFAERLPRGVSVADSRTFVMNMQVATPDGVLNPWGSLATGAGTPIALGQLPSPGSTWALSDADQRHPHVAAAPWRNTTPADPRPDQRRDAVFFDGHVESLPPAAFQRP